MAEPADLLKAWDQVIRQLKGAAAPLTGAQNDLAKLFVVPIQKQAELLEQVLRRQIDLEKQVAQKVLAPVNVVLELAEQSAAAMRAQAQAFEAASASFHQASELLGVQAALLEKSIESMRDPVGTVRSAGSAVSRRSRPATDD